MDFFPVHARVRCIDLAHRDHQHYQTVGQILDTHVSLTMGGTEKVEAEVAWLDRQDPYRTFVQRHDPSTLERVYTRKDYERMRDELKTELTNLREDV